MGYSWYMNFLSCMESLSLRVVGKCYWVVYKYGNIKEIWYII